ncbi:MAG: hypothetical protein QME42_04210 [bacterium]|nr:hypothetical protein [bacterium]
MEEIVINYEEPKGDYYALLIGISDYQDKDKDRSITITEVYDYIYKKVEEKSRELTGFAQHPQYFGSREGNRILTIIK